jgi:uncharacterized phiE125 gp8 family phage protein
MNIIVVTEPPVEPVTIAEAYEHLRWDPEIESVGSPPEDVTVYPLGDLVERNIRSARLYVEQATRRSLVLQTLRLTAGSLRDLELLRPPFVSLQGVEYLNDEGVATELDTADFFVTDDYVPKLRAYSRVADACYDLARDRDDCVRVTYIAGYPPTYDAQSPPEVVSYTANIPAALKDAILLQVQLLCDRFDDGEKTALERTRDSLISSYRVHTF